MITRRHHITPAVFLILIKQNKVLLLRRKNTGFYDGYYDLVSGHVESSESMTQAIVREAKEEANSKIKPNDLKAVHFVNRNQKSNPIEIRERIDAFFMTKKWTGEIMNNEPNKCNDLKWFPINKLPKNIVPHTKQAINNFKNKIIYSEYGFDK